MKISENVFALKIEDGGHTIYPALLKDPETGCLALVDAGWPGQFPLFEEALQREGFSLSDIELIILTHQDCDHIACVPDFRKKLPRLRIACFTLEEAYIDGRNRPCKVSALEKVFDTMTAAEKEEFYPYRKRYLESRTPVDEVFGEGIAFPHAGGTRVIHSPGHTPGHVCLLAEGVLIAGDALNAAGGKLIGPKEDKCEDYGAALDSLGKLEPETIAAVICYHGGPVPGNPSKTLIQLRNRLR